MEKQQSGVAGALASSSAAFGGKKKTGRTGMPVATSSFADIHTSCFLEKSLYKSCSCFQSWFMFVFHPLTQSPTVTLQIPERES